MINEKKAQLNRKPVDTYPKLELKDKKYIFMASEYNQKEWEQKLANYLSFNKNEVSLRKKPKNLEKLEFGPFILRNIKNSSFSMQILPCSLFLVLSLVILWGGFKNQGIRNLLVEPQIVILLFLGAVFLIFAIVFLIKILILKEKVIRTGSSKRVRYIHLNRVQYEGILKLFPKKNYIYFKEIKEERISIRELRKNDAKSLFLTLKDPLVTKYLGFSNFTKKKQAKNLINRARIEYLNQDIFYLGITLNTSNEVIGYIGLSKYDLTEDTCQIVYAIGKDYWGKGLMVAAVKLFNNYLFEKLHKKIIIATYIEENINSAKVMIKSGMQRDEMFDMEMMIKGKTELLKAYTIKRREENEKI